MTPSERPPQRHGQQRASRACEYCRKKRLKCTPEQHPCLNCQLYREECVYTERKKRNSGVGRPFRSSGSVGRKPLQRTNQVIETQEMVSNAGEPTAIIVDSLLAEQTDTNPKRPQNTLVSPGPTDTLPSNNGTGDSLQWDLEYPSAVDQLHQQHSLETTAYSEVENGYTSLAQGWELQVPMDYWDLDLPVNMEAFEPESTILGPKTVSTLSETGRVSGIFSFAGDQTETNLQPAIPVGLFIAKDPRVNSFIGLHSAGSTLAICLKDCSASSQILGQLDHVQFLFNAGPHINECNVPEETKTLSREFPARDFAEFGIRAYFRNIHPIYPIIDRQIFLENWPSLYNTEPEQLDAITYSAFVLLVAIGALSDSSRCGVTDYQTSVLKLYWQSWYLLDKIQLNKEGFAWVLCGTASRMAQSLGLHRRSPTRFNLGEPEVYLRSHLWWAILSLDSFLSAVECRPPSLPPSMCDHDILPLNINTLPMDACTGDVADTYYWSLRLTRIRHEYCVIVNRCESVYSRLDALATLDHRLLQWREEVPPDIRPGQQIIAPKALYHFVALLHLDYFHILCSIHWASILSTTNPVILKAHQSIRIQSSEHICVAAARSFVDVLNGLNTEYDGSTLFPITFHSHSCIIVSSLLYRNVILHPHRITAKGDLEYFRAGKLHLEGQRYPGTLSPTLQGLFESMLQAAENLLATTATMTSTTSTTSATSATSATTRSA